ncbi:MAG: 4-(cytidine 5'-diphospho)-2-C-methyl-D-erythritol kinase [bacterium]|nr:4-(cytidine 5'-diphospho)-2-C-methyl-D-erythritol kinase [bacterium]
MGELWERAESLAGGGGCGLREGGGVERVQVISPAKINWFLDVGARRVDGYHEVKSVMQMISLCDEIECVARGDGEIVFEHEGEPCGCEAERNLAVRAAKALRECVGVAWGVEIRLRKRIPVGAGLGGGSSNAASVLKAVSRLWGVEVKAAMLQGLARGLGADVAFFLGSAAAICTGIGECTKALAPRKHWVVIWNPGRPLATRRVYEQFDRRVRPHRELSDFVEAYENGAVERLAAAVWNNLGIAAEECMPELGEMQVRMRGAGAKAVWVSGSGPSVVGLCRDERHAQSLAKFLREGASRGERIEVCYTLTERPE